VPLKNRDVEGGKGGPVTFLVFCFFYSSTELQPTPVNQFLRTIGQKTRFGVRKTLWDEKCVVLKFGVCYSKNTLKMGREGQLLAKIKCRITLKR